MSYSNAEVHSFRHTLPEKDRKKIVSLRATVSFTESEPVNDYLRNSHIQ